MYITWCCCCAIRDMVSLSTPSFSSRNGLKRMEGSPHIDHSAHVHCLIEQDAVHAQCTLSCFCYRYSSSLPIITISCSLFLYYEFRDVLWVVMTPQTKHVIVTRWFDYWITLVQLVWLLSTNCFLFRAFNTRSVITMERVCYTGEDLGVVAHWVHVHHPSWN